MSDYGPDITSAIPVSIGSADTGWEIRDAVRDIFEIHDITYGIGRANAIRLRGRLLMDSGRAYDIVDERFRRLDYTPLFRRDGEVDVILAVRAGARVASSRTTVALVLLALTILSMLFAGANGNVVESRGWFWGLLSGWPFAVSLIVILLAHELGHYFTARHYGVPVSLPYFIPMPFNVLGTMGAFIQMKAPPKNRRQLLAIAAAGPLAGFVVAVPVMLVGLFLSEVGSLPSEGVYLMLGNSLLGLALQRLVFGKLLLGGGEDVFLHGVALAGWAGFLVTAMNLVPAGQLDGGHVAYALLGDKAGRLKWAVAVMLFGLGFLWEGWFLWAALSFVFGRVVAVPLDDVTPLGARGRAVAIAVAFIFIMVFTPVPFELVTVLGMAPGV
ncbi:MAG: site-2 protease family protein [Chloroflexota bacterium]|nr:site-2 protease family protein [Anaerolineae bacterium]